MAASVLTLYVDNPRQSNSSAGLLDTAAPTASTSTTGWTVGTEPAADSSRLSFGIEKPRTSFLATLQPSGAPSQENGHWAEDCFRISAATTGDFSAGTWYSSLSVIAVTAGADQDGRARVRLWRSSSESAQTPTEITAGVMIGGATTNLATTVAQSSSASTQIGAFSLANEYLFMQCAWEVTGAGGGTTRDVLVRLGPLARSSGDLIGSGLETPLFTTAAAGADPGGGGGFLRRRRDAMSGAN